MLHLIVANIKETSAEQNGFNYKPACSDSCITLYKVYAWVNMSYMCICDVHYFM